MLGGRWPDLTLVFDIDPAIGLARAGRQRFEAKGIGFHQCLRDAFAEIARREPQRCRLIDASGGVAVVAERVWAAVAPTVQAS